MLLSVIPKTQVQVPASVSRDKFQVAFDAEVVAKRAGVLPGVEGAFLVENLLSRVECASLIEESEKRGFQSLETEFLPEDRNNERILVVDPAMAAVLFDRLAPCMEVSDVLFVQPTGFGNHGIWRFLPSFFFFFFFFFFFLFFFFIQASWDEPLFETGALSSRYGLCSSF
jgi:hypothetical protein